MALKDILESQAENKALSPKVTPEQAQNRTILEAGRVVKDNSTLPNPMIETTAFSNNRPLSDFETPSSLEQWGSDFLLNNPLSGISMRVAQAIENKRDGYPIDNVDTTNSLGRDVNWTAENNAERLKIWEKETGKKVPDSLIKTLVQDPISQRDFDYRLDILNEAYKTQEKAQGTGFDFIGDVLPMITDPTSYVGVTAGLSRANTVFQAFGKGGLAGAISYGAVESAGLRAREQSQEEFLAGLGMSFAFGGALGGGARLIDENLLNREVAQVSDSILNNTFEREELISKGIDPILSNRYYETNSNLEQSLKLEEQYRAENNIQKLEEQKKVTQSYENEKNKLETDTQNAVREAIVKGESYVGIIQDRFKKASDMGILQYADALDFSITSYATKRNKIDVAKGVGEQIFNDQALVNVQNNRIFGQERMMAVATNIQGIYEQPLKELTTNISQKIYGTGMTTHFNNKAESDVYQMVGRMGNYRQFNPDVTDYEVKQMIKEDLRALNDLNKGKMTEADLDSSVDSMLSIVKNTALKSFDVYEQFNKDHTRFMRGKQNQDSIINTYHRTGDLDEAINSLYDFTPDEKNLIKAEIEKHATYSKKENKSIKRITELDENLDFGIADVQIKTLKSLNVNKWDKNVADTFLNKNDTLPYQKRDNYTPIAYGDIIGTLQQKGLNSADFKNFVLTMFKNGVAKKYNIDPDSVKVNEFQDEIIKVAEKIMDKGDIQHTRIVDLLDNLLLEKIDKALSNDSMSSNQRARGLFDYTTKLQVKNKDGVDMTISMMDFSDHNFRKIWDRYAQRQGGQSMLNSVRFKQKTLANVVDEDGDIDFNSELKDESRFGGDIKWETGADEYSLATPREQDLFFQEIIKEGRVNKLPSKEIEKQITFWKEVIAEAMGVPTIKDPTSAFQQSYRIMKNWNFMRLLGMTGLSAITEVGSTIFTYGVRNALEFPSVKYLKDQIANGKMNDKLSQEIATYFDLSNSYFKQIGRANDAELGLYDNPNNMASNELNRNKFLEKMENISDKGLEMILTFGGAKSVQNFLERWNATALFSEIINMANNPNLTRTQKNLIKEIGLDMDMMKRITEQIQTHGKTEAKKWSNGNKVTELNMENWTDLDAKHHLIVNTKRYVNTVIQRTALGDKLGITFGDKLFKNTFGGQVALELKDYLLTSYNKQFRRLLARQDMFAMGYVATSTLATTLGYLLKGAITTPEGGEREKNYYKTENIIKGTLTQIPTLGYLPTLVDFASVGFDNKSGSNAFDGKITAQLPVFNLFNSLIGAFQVGTGQDVSPSQFRRGLSVLPFSNLYGVGYAKESLVKAYTDNRQETKAEERENARQEQ